MTTKEQAQNPAPEEFQELSLEDAASVKGGGLVGQAGGNRRPPPRR